MKADAVITHCGNRIGYTIVRSLGQKGLRVVTGTDGFSGMGVYSRYAYKRFSHPSFVTDEKAFLKKLYQVFRDYAPRVCIPADEDIFVISRHRNLFSDVPVAIPVADAAVLHRLHDKHLSTQLAQSLGIPVPETLKPKNGHDIDAFLQQHGGPLVLKRVQSSAARGVFHLDGETIHSALHGLLEANMIRYGDFIVQTCAGGTGYGVSMLFNHGRLRAKFTHKRLREKSFTGGPSTLRVSTKNSTLEDYAERLLGSVGFHGVAMVEFRHDDQSGDSWFLEVNPRFWGSLALAVRSGVDFPYLLYRMVLEGDIDPCLDYTTGIVVRWLLGDMLSIFNYAKSGHPGAALASMLTRAHGHDDFSWDDPLPLAAELFLYVNKIVRSRFLQHG